MSLQVEVAEAICSALYQMPFAEFLGERDEKVNMPEEQMARHLYFHIGVRPKDMRVTVIRPEKSEMVAVRVEWRNYFADPRNPLKCEQTIRISTYAASQAMLHGPTEEAVVRVLEIYKDVLSESGVAGRISDLVDAPEETDDGTDG